MTAEQLKASLITYAMKGGLSASWRKEHNYSFELWQNLPLSKICHAMTYGTARKSSSEGDVVVIRMGNLQGGEIIWSKLVYTTNRDDIEKYLLTPGDILFNRTNSPELVGKTSIYRGERPAIYAGYLIKLDYDKNIIIGEYLNYVMNSKEERQFCAKVRVNGVCQANINAKKIGAFSIPVPPIDEQQYIVSCLNELLPLVEEYGKSQSALHVLETELPGKLRASLLQQAIMGKLVPQLDDEPAVDIDAEEPEEVPFVIPEKWKWVRLGAILSDIEAGKSYKCIEIPPVAGQCGIVKVSAVTWGTFFQDESKTCYDNNCWKQEYAIHAHDFLISRANTADLVGSCVIVEHISKKLMLSDKILRLRFSSCTNTYFLLWVMRTKMIRCQLLQLATGTSNSMKNISQEAIKSLQIPLPPLAEQRRIVARLNELLPYLDRIN